MCNFCIITSHSAWSGAALPATAGPATVAPTGSRPRGYNGCSPYLYNGMLPALRQPLPPAALLLHYAARGARSGATLLGSGLQTS